MNNEEAPCKQILDHFRRRRLKSTSRQPATSPNSRLHFVVPFIPFLSYLACHCFLTLLMARTTYGFFISSAVGQQRQVTLKRTPTARTTAQTVLRITWPELEAIDVTETGDMWQSGLSEQVYVSPLLWKNNLEWKTFIQSIHGGNNTVDGGNGRPVDYVWEQVKLEAVAALRNEPGAGPQLYQSILSQGSLLEAIVTIVAHEIETDFIKATELKKLFLDLLTPEDIEAIHCDAIAAATRSCSLGLASLAILFQTGLHALVCYRVGHRLWQEERTGLAYYLQSTVSRQYSADIHPACQLGRGIYLRTGAGVVIGETATVGDDVCILQGVTLGGTGKETGDRHPKVQAGVVLHDSATVLGNILVGTGAVVSAKAIVTKPVKPLAIMSGVPARPISTRELSEEAFQDSLERHLAIKYLDNWRALKREMDSKGESNTVRK